MKPNKKAKWIVGITGTTLSALILSQLDTNAASNDQNNQPVAYTEVSANNTNVSSNREKELVKKDWSNFAVDSNSEKKSAEVASNQSTEKSTNKSTDTVKKSTTSQKTSQPASKPAAQQSQPANDTTVNQPVVQQPVYSYPATDRNTSRS